MIEGPSPPGTETRDCRRTTGRRLPERRAVCGSMHSPRAAFWRSRTRTLCGSGELGFDGRREHELQPIPGADGRAAGVGTWWPRNEVLLRWPALLAADARRQEADRGVLAVSGPWMGARIAVLVSPLWRRAGPAPGGLIAWPGGTRDQTWMVERTLSWSAPAEGARRGQGPPRSVPASPVARPRGSGLGALSTPFPSRRKERVGAPDPLLRMGPARPCIASPD
jgi:hypothetical protein